MVRKEMTLTLAFLLLVKLCMFMSREGSLLRRGNEKGLG